MESTESELRRELEKLIEKWGRSTRDSSELASSKYDSPNSSSNFSRDYHKGSSHAFETCASELKNLVHGGW